MQSTALPPSSQMMGPFMQPMNTQVYSPSIPMMQTMGHNLINQQMLYGHGQQQYLRGQRIGLHHQFNQQAKLGEIEQHKKDYLEVAAVASALGNRVAALENLPFKVLAHDQKPHQYGVVRLSNLPYSVTRHEIHQLLGRHACVLGPELGGGVHIIMERSTAKTMDAFVEFETQKDAESTVRRLSFTESGRYARLGTRHVDVSLSSQDELLRDIFPRAKCVEWRGGNPLLLENTDPYSAGFQGFLTKEEIRGLITHAENPGRSPFTERCRQRTYESLISTLWKYPWNASTMYTVEDRDDLYQAAVHQMLELCEKAKQRRFLGLNEALLHDLLRAGLSCPAFNERQKFCLITASELTPLQPITHWKQIESWPFDCLAKQPTATEYEIMYYSQLIRKGLGVYGQRELIVPNNYCNRYHHKNESPWGCLWIEWNLHNKEMMFKAAAQLELHVVQEILHAALQDGYNTQRQPQALMPCASPQKFLQKSEVIPNQIESNQSSVDHNWSLPTAWAEETAKRAIINTETPSRRSRVSGSISAVSENGSFVNSTNGGFRSNSSSTAFSGTNSLNASTNSSFTTADSDKKPVSQNPQPHKQIGQLSSSEPGERVFPDTAIPRRQHSLSMSSVAVGAIPSKVFENDSRSSGHSRRGESISIPAYMNVHSGGKPVEQYSWVAPYSASESPSTTRIVSYPTDKTTADIDNITNLMARHNILPSVPSKVAAKTPPSPSGALNRNRFSSRHTSVSSLASHHNRLASVSEDDEDVFRKRMLDAKM
ncbi:hypothetical protein BGW36DRAFT_428957 [Talaromyces proteolyticus]|uniref:RRM domain-containing protein n=1 Tax=Talaromyces proteolyticus TaxID=1131652 RepID=A0AAD4PYE0_9EURO|nr:uncharacterized protein BGW36DRAFT_428957 [Talaromyces proteolyticus]KAH8695068.1 hypothetical protein BGW36DRAFT_428957 [Talaromyces proteolyticus]